MSIATPYRYHLVAVSHKPNLSCPSMIDTYNSKFPNGDIAHGGYSTVSFCCSCSAEASDVSSQAIRAHEQFVFPIPDGLDLDNVAPMFCAGITMFSPLKRHGAGSLLRFLVMFSSNTIPSVQVKPSALSASAVWNTAPSSERKPSVPTRLSCSLTRPTRRYVPQHLRRRVTPLIVLLFI